MQFPYGVHLTREGDTFEDPKRYKRLVGKLYYVSITHPDIAHLVSTCLLQQSTIGQLLNRFYVT